METTAKQVERLLSKKGKTKSFEYLQDIFGKENVFILKPYKGNTIRKIEHYGEKLEIWRKDEKRAMVFTNF